MPTPLVIEHLDVVEQLDFGHAAAFEAFAEFALERRKEALHHGVVVAVSSAAHAAGDAALDEDRLVVLARVGAPLIRVVQEPYVRTAPLEGHLERLDRSEEHTSELQSP